MPGPTPSGIPPEVPEEFAEAYRAAYEAAMEAQSVPLSQGEHAARPGRDRGTSVELPERTRAIRIGTHRAQDVDDLTTFERVRGSAWFVPLLLAALALLLVIGAYVVGRAFSDSVGSRPQSAHQDGQHLKVSGDIGAGGLDRAL